MTCPQVIKVITPGPPGPAGPAGPAGPTGPAGLGAAWQQGAGAPGAGVGGNGDFYLNTTNGDIYGPKTAGAWGSSIFNIAEGQEGPAGPAGPTGATGAAGPAGADGRTLLSGTSAPGSGVGANGDFFINTATSVFYGPKAGGAWPAGVSLVGPAGATGAVGPTGPQGPAGAAGATGPAGPAGAAGSSAYQVAVAGGFVGTEAQWLASLVGPQGPAGATGPAGAAGATGPQGPAGPTGAAGSAATVAVGTVTTGAAGSPATVTNAGTSSAAVLNFAIPRGDTGATGPAGATGAQGPAGVVAATAPITYDSGTQTVAISAATTSAAGSMSAADKAKLDGIASGAQVNVATDITYDAASREVRSSTGTDAVLPLVSTSSAGLAPATSFSTITYAADVELDMAALDGQYRTISLTGNLSLTSINRANGRTVVLRLICDGTQRTLTFQAGWVFIGAKPANIAASKTAVLSLTFFGTNNTDAVAAYALQS